MHIGPSIAPASIHISRQNRKMTYALRATWDGADDQAYANNDLINTPAKGVEDGALRLTEVDGTLSVENNKFKFTVQATSAWGDQGARKENSIVRSLGKALFFTVNLSNLGVNGFILGWSTANDLNTPSHRRRSWWPNGSTGRLMIQITGSGSNPGIVDPMLTDTDYELVVVLGGFNSDGDPYYSGQDENSHLFGAQFFRKDGGLWTLAWVDHKEDVSPLYPSISNHSCAGTVKPFNVPDRDYRTVMHPSHFSSFKGVVGTDLAAITPERGSPFVLNGLWDIQAGGATTQGAVPAAPRWTAISEFYFSDGFLHVPITPVAGEVGGIIFREANGDFLGAFIAEAANSFIMYEVISDDWTPKDSKSITITPGVKRIIKVRMEGQGLIAMLDDTTATLVATSALNVNSTKHGMRSNVAGNIFERLIGYPLTSAAYRELDDN